MLNRILPAVVVACFTAALPGAASASDPSGTWVGDWVSSSTGHQGPIKAHIRQVDGCTYRACFCGRFLHVVPFAYSVPMQVTGRTASGATILTASPGFPASATSPAAPSSPSATSTPATGPPRTPAASR